MQLRPNQVDATRIGIDFFKSEKKPSIIVAPTAYGKSVVIAHIVAGIEGKTIILQPSKELLEQNYKKFRALGGNASIFSASLGMKRLSNTATYATIGSVYKLGELFKAHGYTNMIVDEIHLYPRSEGMFGQFTTTSGIKKVLGLTATPFKLQSNVDQFGNAFSKLQMLTSMSKKGKFFHDIIYVNQIQDIVKLGYWAKLSYQVYDFDTSELVFNSSKADYTEESLENSYKKQDLHGKVMRKLAEISDRKSIIVFVPSVGQAQYLASVVPNAAAVYASMPDHLRESAIQRFRDRYLRVIFNVNILSVGFDYPQIDAIIMARPTASLAWFYQAVGRGTRIHPDKKDCLVIDFAGNVQKFGRIEELYYKKEIIWKCFGEGGKLLTGIPLHEIGKKFDNGRPEIANDGKVRMPFGIHAGKELREVPKNYRNWMLREFTWTERNENLRSELIKLQESGL